MAFLDREVVIKQRPDLAAGVDEYERHNPPIGTPCKGEYRFTFGMHEGKTVVEVPFKYIWFHKPKRVFPRTSLNWGPLFDSLSGPRSGLRRKRRLRQGGVVGLGLQCVNDVIERPLQECLTPRAEEEYALKSKSNSKCVHNLKDHNIF